MKIHIKNGRLIDPKNNIDGKHDLFIAAGKIVAIGNAPSGFTPNKTIDATNQIIIPGLVDLAARLREPGYEYKAKLESEMAAAAAGGVTSLACPPDTDPPLDEPGLVEMLKQRAKSLNLSHVYPIGALTVGLKGVALTEMSQLTAAGCVAFSQADAPITDTQVLMRALEYAATFGYPVWLRPQDAHLARGGVAHDGEVATRLGLPGIPACAETIAIAVILQLVKKTGARIHLCRLSTAAGLDMVREAKKQKLPVTCDVSAHHQHLSEMDIGYFDSRCNLTPPLRSLRDRDGLRAALKDGTADALCSDHAPVDDDAKLVPFGEAETGATGLELLLPLALKWAREMDAPISAAVAAITAKPAAILGIDAGHLSVGAPADICVFDSERHWKIEPAALKSQGKNSPFTGLELQGKVTHTLVGGHSVFET
ncbi:MAG: dihydroorotase, multifunctional complex type [Pseudomonadota bacterium]